MNRKRVLLGSIVSLMYFLDGCNAIVLGADNSADRFHQQQEAKQGQIEQERLL